MKARNFFLFMLVVMLALGLTFVSCDSGSKSSAGPRLDHLFLVTDEDSRNFNWQNDRTSFPAGSGVAFLIYGNNPEHDVIKISVTIKKGGNIIHTGEIDILAPANPDPSGDYSIIWGFGTYPVTQPGNDWSAEVYVVDVMGNRSNTRTRTFTVN